MAIDISSGASAVVAVGLKDFSDTSHLDVSFLCAADGLVRQATPNPC